MPRLTWLNIGTIAMSLPVAVSVINCDQRRDVVKGLVPGTQPVTMLERGAMSGVQAQCGRPPVAQEID